MRNTRQRLSAEEEKNEEYAQEKRAKATDYDIGEWICYSLEVRSQFSKNTTIVIVCYLAQVLPILAVVTCFM